MSATETAAALYRQRSSIPGRARIYYYGVALAGLTILLWNASVQRGQITDRVLDLLPWTILLIVLNLLPLPGRLSAHLAVDQPICTAAAIILTPLEVAMVGLVGSFDTKELRGEIGLAKGLFNRVQTALSYYVGSVAVHAIADHPGSSSYVVALAFLALSSQTLTNYLLVGTALSIEHRRPFPQVIGLLRVGTVTDFWLSFMAGSVLGAMLAALYDQVHPLTLLAFVGPVMLARQALKRSQMFVETAQAYQVREQAIAHMTERIHEERSDERRLIAADLHDEVLQPLFKVTLMAHVLKADLATGKLLSMDEDMPQLVRAAELASGTLRDLIGDLRRSALGRGGLAAAIRNLVRTLKDQTSAEIGVQVEVVSTDAAKELVAYQIAKEALANAISHSNARGILVTLRQDSDGLYLGVRDDGVGFDPLSAREAHYGLQIMRERATAIGGCLTLDSATGQGCSVALYLPTKTTEGEAPAANAPES